jgi:hypothetical protein
MSARSSRAEVRVAAAAANGRVAARQARAARRPLLAGRAIEALESRVLFATDFLLNGTQLTTIVNGSPGAPQTVANVNDVRITGDAGANRVTVQNFAGTVTIDGRGGADVVTVHAGGGGTVNVADTAPTPADPATLIVRAPTTVQANVAVSPTRVTVGSDTVNYAAVGAVSLIGQLFSNGDHLTLNGTAAGEQVTVTGSTLSLGGTSPIIYYSTFSSLTVNGGGGADTFTVAGGSVPTTVNAAAGTAAFVVNSNSVPLTLNGGGGTNSYTVNSSSGPLTVNGGAGHNAVVVNGSSSGLALNGGSTTNTYAVNGNSASLTVTGGGTANAVTVNANSGTLTVNGTTGTDAYTVNATTGTVTLRGGSGSTTYAVTAPTLAPVAVVGGSGSGALSFAGTPLRDVFAVTGGTVNAGTGATVTYAGLTSLTVNGAGGNDTFTVAGGGTPTTLLGGSTAASAFNVLSSTALVTVNTGPVPSVVNLGSNMPAATGNTLSALTGGVTVVGNGGDLLTLDDSATVAARTGTLTATALTGVAPGTLTYGGVATLALKLGAGNDALNFTGTALGTTTSVNAGGGTNTFALGSAVPAPGGVVDNVRGELTLTGSGNDALTVDDTGSNQPKTAALTPAALTGLSPAAVSYTGMRTLAVNLGSGGVALDVADTHAGTATTLRGGAGADTLTIQAASSPTTITPAAGRTRSASGR